MSTTNVNVLPCAGCGHPAHYSGQCTGHSGSSGVCVCRTGPDTHTAPNTEWPKWPQSTWEHTGSGLEWELREVRKIACALIRSGENRYPIPETAWEIWRGIKAGQERKP